MKSKEIELTRREFITAATAALTVLGLGGNTNAMAAEKAAARRLGISDAAYEQAQTRAQALVAQMTTAEKIHQLGNGADAIARLNVPAYNYYASEALHGVCSGPPVTSFPVPLGLAAAWNPDLAHSVYTAVSEECRAHGNLTPYSPATLNLHRDPRWGRCYEAPGEDPCLAATIAVQVVRGMQGDDPNYLRATACSKHFICNNTDNDRDSVSATVDQRSFWEFYTRAYRATVINADLFTLMGAYSAINGVPCCASKALMTDLLRGQWGFRGYVTSDCDAIADIHNPHHFVQTAPEAAALGIKAGCDVDCGGTYPQYLQAAVDQNLVTDADLGVAVTRLMTVRHLLGLFDPPGRVPYTTITLKTIDWNAHSTLAVEAARQSIVLLKNDSSFLPLDPKKVKKIAVIGPLGDVCHLGAYSGSPATQISPLKGIAGKLGIAVSNKYISGGDYANLHGTIQPQDSPVGTTQLAFISDGDWAEFDHIDFTDRTSVRARVASAGAGGHIELHVDKVTGPLACTLDVASTGNWNHLVDVTAPLAGVTGKHKLFVVFRGGGGYLLNVERLILEPMPAEPSWAGDGPQVLFRGGCGVTNDRDPVAFQDAVDIAKGADVVFLVCGVNSDVDGEGHDRTDIKLTGAQPDLIQAVYAANPNTVLVLNSNNSVSIEWEKQNIPAIVGAICAGQAQGTAIADVLFGDYNPGGKLPCTWYKSIDQLPPSHDYDIHNGRTYMYFADEALYPFGYGLSYTTFEIGGLHAASTSLGTGGTAKYSVQVKNTGKRTGAEVVQLYVVPPPSPVKRPLRQLAAFQRVELNPGKTKTVVFELPYSTQAFWYWDDGAKAFVCSAGEAHIEIGNSSANLPLTASLTLEPGSMAGASAPDAVDTVAATSHVV